MRSVRELLEGLELPPVGARADSGYRLEAAHVLGAALPQGHLHVWSGAPGAGKTAFLLGLLCEAARHARPTLLATYDLSEAALALRLLAMEAGVALEDLDGGKLVGSDASAAAQGRARLGVLPLYLLEARGLSVSSLEDRLVRSRVRIEVLGVDYVEAVVHASPGRGNGVPSTLHELSELAKRRWLSVVATVRTSRSMPCDAKASGSDWPGADRVGWIAPADERGAAQASLVANRHGELSSCRMRLDARSARWVENAPTTASRVDASIANGSAADPARTAQIPPPPAA